MSRPDIIEFRTDDSAHMVTCQLRNFPFSGADAEEVRDAINANVTYREKIWAFLADELNCRTDLEWQDVNRWMEEEADELIRDRFGFGLFDEEDDF